LICGKQKYQNYLGKAIKKDAKPKASFMLKNLEMRRKEIDLHEKDVEGIFIIAIIFYISIDDIIVLCSFIKVRDRIITL
jgi:hypothetical protein